MYIANSSPFLAKDIEAALHRPYSFVYDWGEPHTNHSYEKIAIAMYVCMYVCMYVYYVCSDTSSTCLSCSMHVHISLFCKDCQRSSHVNSNCSSPKQEPVPELNSREQPFERQEKQT